PSKTSGQPIVGMGRFSHEAVALDPRTGHVYLTEDDRNRAGLYRYVPDDTSGRNGALAKGGRLQAARVRGRRHVDLTVASIGDAFVRDWEDIGAWVVGILAAWASAAGVGGGGTVRGLRAQAWARGAVRRIRGEGIWRAGKRFFIVATSTVVDGDGR